MSPVGHADRRVRVVQVIDRLNVGGPAFLAAAIGRGLDPERFVTLLVTGNVEPGEGDFLSVHAPAVDVVRVDGLGRAPHPWDDLRGLHGIHRVLRAFRPDVVHTHKAKAGALGRIAAWAVRAPATVHTFHGHLLHGYFSPAATRLVTAVERNLARRTTSLVAVGARVRDDLLDAGIGRPEQYTVVPPGVSPPTPPPRHVARKALGVRQDAPVVGFVGRLAPVKRPDRFVALATEIARTHPGTTFLVAGDGELGAEVRRRARPLGDDVVFLGWRPDTETVYAACDVIVLTSDNEGMPLSLIEAGMAAVPVVTTGVGSTPEVVIDAATGFVVRPSESELADATRRLLDDAPLRARMGEAASRHTHAAFGVDALVAATERLYLEALRARHSDAPA